ncbi:hypothetical protein D3C87_773320 [compost metagenome]
MQALFYSVFDVKENTSFDRKCKSLLGFCISADQFGSENVNLGFIVIVGGA